jgi:hypothetical protein
MGRYYSGDIEGKFWFGVQSSMDAESFGGEYDMLEDEEGNEYGAQFSFFTKDIPDIEEGLKTALEELGEDNKKKLDDFFAKVNSYNNEMIEKETGIPVLKVKELLEPYARYLFGEEILKCVQEKGQCVFEAEL